MNLDKETIKKIRGLIVFTAIILIGLWNYEVVLDGLGFIGRVIFPFVLGGAIAFVLNVPMHFIEEKFFGSKKMKKILEEIFRRLFRKYRSGRKTFFRIIRKS